MITADKIFKGTTQVSKIYQGRNLVWEQPITKYIKWQPTTYISASGSYSKSLSGKRSDSVKLLIKGYTSIDITISYSVNVNQEDHYIKAYNLDSTSSVNSEINSKGNRNISNSKTITYTIPDDGAEHSIYFSCYGGYYGSYTGTFNISYSNASSAYIKWATPSKVNGNVYSWNIKNVEVGTEKDFFTLKGTKKVNITAYIYTGLDEDRDHPYLTFTCFKPNSTEILKTLEITDSTGNHNTATFDILGEGVVNFEVWHSNWEVNNTLKLTVNSIE